MKSGCAYCDGRNCADCPDREGRIIVVDKPDPWPPAQEALFNVVRAWVKEENEGDPQKTAEECLKIMKEVNQTEGAPFIFVCELARVLAENIARHLADLNGELPSREEVMEEIDILELEYIEESVLAEEEDEDEPSSEGTS